MSNIKYWAFIGPHQISDLVASRCHESGSGYRAAIMEGDVCKVLFTVYADFSVWVQVRDELRRDRWSFVWSSLPREDPGGPGVGNYLSLGSCLIFNEGNLSTNYDALFRVLNKRDGFQEVRMIRTRPGKEFTRESLDNPLVKLPSPDFGRCQEYLRFDYGSYMNAEPAIADELFPGGETIVIPHSCR